MQSVKLSPTKHYEWLVAALETNSMLTDVPAGESGAVSMLQSFQTS